VSRLRVFEDARPDVAIEETRDQAAIARALAQVGVRFEQWRAGADVAPGAPAEVVMAAYQADIDKLTAEHGFKTVDVVSVAPDHPQREAMRARFLDEHYHLEDEVRFFVGGAGMFTLHIGTRVYEVLCEKDDLISVPAKTTHWFDMGPAPSFIAIRFFKEPDGWVGHFTGTDIAQRFPRIG
jgi:1,2-dihydroxy-3-keto-5-methylthiopentene dioxygenase